MPEARRKTDHFFAMAFRPRDGAAPYAADLTVTVTTDPDAAARQAVEAHLGHRVEAAAWFSPLFRGLERRTEPPEVVRQERALPSPVFLAVSAGQLFAFDVTWPGPAVHEHGRWPLSSVEAMRTGPRLMKLTPSGAYRCDEVRPRHPGNAAQEVLELLAPEANRQYEERVRIVPLALTFLASSVFVFLGVLYRARVIENETWDYGVAAGSMGAAAWMAMGLSLSIVIDRYRRSIRCSRK